MIAALDSATPPTAAQAQAARAGGVRLWSGYLATRPNVGLLRAWSQAEFDTARLCGGTPIAYCSGWDDPAAVRQLAAAWNVRACLDVESGIRGDGPWVQMWLDTSGAGLYGNHPVFTGRRAAFYVLAGYPGRDPSATWFGPVPPGPHGWQWQGTHDEFGVSVDRSWFDDWFAQTEEEDEMKILKRGAAAYRLSGLGTIAQISSDQLTAYLDAAVPSQDVSQQTIDTLMVELPDAPPASAASVAALKAELDAIAAHPAVAGDAALAAKVDALGKHLGLGQP